MKFNKETLKNILTMALTTLLAIMFLVYADAAYSATFEECEPIYTEQIISNKAALIELEESVANLEDSVNELEETVERLEEVVDTLENQTKENI